MVINLLSHVDFIKLLQWTLIEAVHGTYAEQVEREKQNIEFTKSFYCFLPKSAFNELNELRSTWSRFALLSRRYCVDVETGELYEPCLSANEKQKS